MAFPLPRPASCGYRVATCQESCRGGGSFLTVILSSSFSPVSPAAHPQQGGLGGSPFTPLSASPFSLRHQHLLTLDDARAPSPLSQLWGYPLLQSICTARADPLYTTLACDSPDQAQGVAADCSHAKKKRLGFWGPFFPFLFNRRLHPSNNLWLSHSFPCLLA